MRLKGRYIVELRERVGSENRIEEARKRVESDAELSAAAIKRKKYGGSDRWWSVGAGLGIVVLFIFSSLNWTVVANIAAVALCAYLLGVFAYILIKRAMLKKIPYTISAERSAKAFFNTVFGIDDELSRLYPPREISDFSRDMASTVIPLIRETGGEPDVFELSVDVNLRLASGVGHNSARIPTICTVRACNVEVIIECLMTYVSSEAGDFIATDMSPEILGSVKRSVTLNEDLPSRVTWDNDTTERWKTANS